MKQLLWFLARKFFSLKKSHFLIILQNNNELRSTGGYITSVFDLEIGKFWLKKRVLSVENELTKHENIEAPKIIQEMLFDAHLKTWTFRDGNYSPDFGKTAKQLIHFYHLVYPNRPADGLLAINYSFIEEWIKNIGAIKINERKIDHQDLFTFVSAQTSDIDRHDLEVLNQRKSILSSLAKKIIVKTLLKPWLWPKLIFMTNQNFKTKELQFYDSKIKQSYGFEIRNNEDFLAVIENNYLGLKTNRYLLRTIDHDSQMAETGELINTVRIKWENLGQNDYPLSGNYRSHVRLYIAKEAFLEAHGFSTYEEDGFRIVDTKILLPPKQAIEKTFKYILPKKYVEEKYQFRFFKQSGVKHEVFRKTFSLPQNFAFKKQNKIPFTEGLVIKNYIKPSSDIVFQLAIEKSKAHPRVYSHSIIGPQEILIRFNEPVQFDEKTISVELCEKNKLEKNIQIEGLTLTNENRWLLIKTKNLPVTEEIFYRLKLKNIKNKNGISVHPNPKSLTIVYRSRHFPYGQKLLKSVQEGKKVQRSLNKTEAPEIIKLQEFKSNFEKNSCYPPGHYYSPIVSVKEIKNREQAIWKNVGKDQIEAINLNSEAQKSLVNELSVYYKEMPFKEEKQSGLRYYLNNPWYAYSDGIILYGMMRHLKPKNIIEIGSGFSSALMLDVNERFFSNEIQLVFIEPYPERLLSLLTEKDKSESIVIQKDLQEIPIEVFKELEKGDILFIDSTHVVKCGSDVQYILFEILPALQSGVIIHFHDIFYPFEYPKQWVLEGRNWNEDYFLRAFLMYNPQFEIKLFSHYLHLHHKKIFKEMPLAYKNSGGNLWIEKK